MSETKDIVIPVRCPECKLLLSYLAAPQDDCPEHIRERLTTVLPRALGACGNLIERLSDEKFLVAFAAAVLMEDERQRNDQRTKP